MVLLFISSLIFTLAILGGILMNPIISLIALATLCFFYIPISIFLKGRLERNSKVVDLGQKKIVRFIQEA